MEPAGPANSQLRLRVFAGPNGSGKSTIIQSIKDYTSAGRPIDFGVYINADDIAQDLQNDSFSFSAYEINPPEGNLYAFAETSGLLNENFTRDSLESAILFDNNSIKLVSADKLDYVAQLLARFLREELLKAKRRFSFERQSSHTSQIWTS